jgi:hypothetical protein
MPPALSPPAVGTDDSPVARWRDSLGFGRSILFWPDVEPATMSGEIVLVLDPAIQIFAYAHPATAILEQAIQAAYLIAALQTFQSNFIELDFTGVEGVSREFTDRFICLAETELPDAWLTPRHYHANCERLIKLLLTRLQLQRERAWADGCDRFMTGAR